MIRRSRSNGIRTYIDRLVGPGSPRSPDGSPERPPVPGSPTDPAEAAKRDRDRARGVHTFYSQPCSDSSFGGDDARGVPGLVFCFWPRLRLGVPPFVFTSFLLVVISILPIFL